MCTIFSIVTSSNGEMGKLEGGSFMLGFGWGDRGWVSYFFSIFCSVFVLLLIVLSWLLHDSLLCLFHCSFFAFFFSGPFNYALQSMEIVVCYFLNYFKSQISIVCDIIYYYAIKFVIFMSFIQTKKNKSLIMHD